MSDNVWNSWLTDQEVNILIRIKNNPEFLAEKWFDKEKRNLLLNEIKSKIISSNPILDEIVTSIEQKFIEMDSFDQNIEKDIESIFVNPIENIVNKVNTFVKESDVEETQDDLKPL